jgi:hypothetical protein
MADVQRIPLTCRLNLWHTWQTFSTEDGHRFKACAKCDKDKPTTDIDTHLFH